MCGIAGAIALTKNGRRYLKETGQAVAALHHRGPDAQGIFNHDAFCFGHTRLAIIDPSEAGAQPMLSDDRQQGIVLNGEIFNFRELRAILESEGCSFRSDSDTEVLLKWMKLKSVKGLNELNGFFAFACFDLESNKIILARDRYGEKPLYFFQTSDVLIFASEVKAIQQFSIALQPDFSAISDYFHLNYIPGDSSVFSAIKKVPAGSFIEIQFRDSVVSTPEKYYTIPRKRNHAITYADAVQKLRELTADAVKLRLVADVPLGTFLSGGLDSSVITALAAQEKPGIESFSIGFADEPFFDETAYAEMVAQKAGTKHHVFRLKNDDLLESLHSMLDRADEPFADSSALAVNILARETRKHVTVALSGDGADELFAGYNKHEAEYRARAKKFWYALLPILNPVAGMLPSSRNSKFSNKIRQFRKFSNGLNLSAADRYWSWAGYSDPMQLKALLKNFTQHHSLQRIPEITELNNTGDFNAVLRADFRLVLENDMLVKVDRMSMLNALEVRPPFLDYRLVDYVMQLPASFKIDQHNRKKILKDAFADLLPPEVVHRPKKGFEVPLLKWFKHELSGTIEDFLNEKYLAEQGIFHPAAVKQIRQQLHSSNPGDAPARIWALIAFQSWYRKNMPLYA